MTTRNLFDPHGVKSRRGGPAKPPLSRDIIVTEALRQLSAHGLAGMSLRKVATALDTGPASLYAYVADLDELHALMLDHALANVQLRRLPKAKWRARLLGVLESYAGVLSGSPGLAQLAFGSVAVGPNALRVTETILALLEEGGVDAATSAWAVDILILYVTAVVAEHVDHASEPDPSAPDGAIAHAIAGASPLDYPHIAATRAHLLSGTPAERFAWAFDVLVDGILARPRKGRRAIPKKPRSASK